MFSKLSGKLLSIFSSIKNRGILTEEILESALSEIKTALLEADVSLSVARAFTSNLKEKLKGQKITASITPDQVVVRAVYDELVSFLGDAQDTDDLSRKKSILIVGLQGSGKTTTAAKLANLMKNKFKKNVLLVSLDTYRPAAVEQLQKLAENNNLNFFGDTNLEVDNPVSIAKRAGGVQNDYDSIIYDTAGRSQIDEQMMAELSRLKETIEPREVLLVVDSMTGQDAVNIAKAFNETTKITGLILTRIDGDSRGGAALSAKFVTNCQIKYMCTGEKIGDIDVFHPDRIASRILDKGDILSLVEKATDENVVVDIPTGKNFDLSGMEKQLKQLEKIGGLGGILKFIPGVGKIKEQIANANINDKMIARQVAIIRSMTGEERKNPGILNASRRRRIATGCGQEVADVNKLLKQFEQMKLMMKNFDKSPEMPKMPKAPKFQDRFWKK
jgi:signal recognition particle subunit SRP54